MKLTIRAFKTPDNLVQAIDPILTVILQTPPTPTYTSQRTAYMLSLSSAIPRYITTLNVDCELGGILELLSKVDQGWQCILRGDVWVPGKKPVRYPGMKGGLDMTEQCVCYAVALWLIVDQNPVEIHHRDG